MRKILSYINSHRYDLHAIFASLFVFGIMMMIKKPIKKLVVKRVDMLIEKKPDLLSKRKLYLKRGNMILILVTFGLGYLFFGLLASISPYVSFSFASATMTGVYALCAYALFEQLQIGT